MPFQEFSRCWAEIDLDRLRHNLEEIRRILAPGVRHCFVVKADGYGHGLVPVSRCAVESGVEWLAVATVAEGMALRSAGIEANILVLSPVLALESDLLAQHNLRNLVEDLEVAHALSVAAQRHGVQIKLHLKVDTGMARFGAATEKAAELAVAIARMPGLVLEGIATHFSSAAVDLDYTQGQYDQFLRVVEEAEARGLRIPLVHCCNSAALLRFSHCQHSLVRSGLLAYGIPIVPCPELDLQPVMTWRTRILAMRQIPAGKRVGYAGRFVTERGTRVATLGTGYADGYPRELSNKGKVLIRGTEAPIRGTVCMDQMMVDVTHIPEARVGDVVGLVEGSVTAERLAEWVNTTPHEIPCRLTGRVPRVYLHE
jgi:alanine racemase